MIAHMNPSGLDATPVSVTNPFALSRMLVLQAEMNLSAYLVIADTGVYGHTREAIQVVQSKARMPHRFACLGRIDPASRSCD